jgi:hypothetical protein
MTTFLVSVKFVTVLQAEPLLKQSAAAVVPVGVMQ